MTETKDSMRYVKIVAWSDEDECYIGSAPGLLLGGCHGDDEKAVFDELCQVVEETIALYKVDGKPLPPATSGRDYTNLLQPGS
jgi:predicted RNase H-like HicB family nuclease